MRSDAALYTWPLGLGSDDEVAQRQRCRELRFAVLAWDRKKHLALDPAALSSQDRPYDLFPGHNLKGWLAKMPDVMGQAFDERYSV